MWVRSSTKIYPSLTTKFDIFDIKSFFCYKHWRELVGFCPFPQKCICSVCGINFEMGKTRIGLGLFFRMMLWLHFLTYVMMTFDTKKHTQGSCNKKENTISTWKWCFEKCNSIWREKYDFSWKILWQNQFSLILLNDIKKVSALVKIWILFSKGYLISTFEYLISNVAIKMPFTCLVLQFLFKNEYF